MPAARVKRTLSLREDTLRMAGVAAEQAGVSLSEFVDKAIRARLSREGTTALATLYTTSADYRAWCDEASTDADTFFGRADAGVA